MRDLNIDELEHVYGAGGKGRHRKNGRRRKGSGVSRSVSRSTASVSHGNSRSVSRS